jgi:hypothetical protein
MHNNNPPPLCPQPVPSPWYDDFIFHTEFKQQQNNARPPPSSGAGVAFHCFLCCGSHVTVLRRRLLRGGGGRRRGQQQQQQQQQRRRRRRNTCRNSMLIKCSDDIQLPNIESVCWSHRSARIGIAWGLHRAQHLNLFEVRLL